ncbi:hypothetical protein V5799_025842 [Amblyomma americanum]|uniref:Uncharacterized protein n=1 Tax=Amblyomma americanum TaxID=6943 RepID=A0AAQ4E8B0_AMBAM
MRLAFEPVPSLDAAVAAQEKILAELNDKGNKLSLPLRTALATQVAGVLRQAVDFRALILDARARAEVLRDIWEASQAELVAARREAEAACREAVVLKERLALAEDRLRPGLVEPARRTFAEVLRSGTALPVGGGTARASVPPPVLGASGDVPVSRVLHAHVAFLTPAAPSRTPARDVAAVLKPNIDPEAAGIGPVVLRHTRLGVTVLAEDRRSLDRLMEAVRGSAPASAAMTVRLAERRRPHVKLIGVDPDVAPDDLVRVLNAQNQFLDLDPASTEVNLDHCKKATGVLVDHLGEGILTLH